MQQETLSIHPAQASKPPMRLQLDAFEGPLDILLHLIREKDLDIFDIPIYQIAEEFQQYVDLAQKLDLERAGDYLSMAAELAHIKSRMLLPVHKDEEDPRQELVDRLIEHEQLQHVAQFLQKRNHLGRDVFLRGNDPSQGIPTPPPPREGLEVSDLGNIFHLLLRRVPKTHTMLHQVKRETVSVRQRILWICDQLRQQSKRRLTEMLEGKWTRPLLIATFLALLELSRLRRIRLTQIDQGEIELEAIGPLDALPLHEVDTFSNLHEELEEAMAQQELFDAEALAQPEETTSSKLEPTLSTTQDPTTQTDSENHE